LRVPVLRAETLWVRALRAAALRVQALRELRERQIQSLTLNRQQGIRQLQYLFFSSPSSIEWLTWL
jgi:hypothetical protein